MRFVLVALARNINTATACCNYYTEPQGARACLGSRPTIFHWGFQEDSSSKASQEPSKDNKHLSKYFILLLVVLLPSLNASAICSMELNMELDRGGIKFLNDQLAAGVEAACELGVNSLLVANKV